jgi:ribosomal-protein-alanine N-acetyltransferase
MPFIMDVMTLDDIPAVMAIEKLAFPIPWPEQAYRHELQENPNGYFIVVRANLAASNGHASALGPPAAPVSTPAPSNSPFQLFQRLTARNGKPAPRNDATGATETSAAARPVVGFAGMWMMVDEAHVSTIASHPDWRGRSVGELLLLSLLREGQRRQAIFATLEVRVTNIVAQNLYRKYGFEEVGRRKRYYHDNGEDALIMTVMNFTEPLYHAQLDALEKKLWARLANGSMNPDTQAKGAL